MTYRILIGNWEGTTKQSPNIPPSTLQHYESQNNSTWVLCPPTSYNPVTSHWSPFLGLVTRFSISPWVSGSLYTMILSVLEVWFPKLPIQVRPLKYSSSPNRCELSQSLVITPGVWMLFGLFSISQYPSLLGYTTPPPSSGLHWAWHPLTSSTHEIHFSRCFPAAAAPWS